MRDLEFVTRFSFCLVDGGTLALLRVPRLGPAQRLRGVR